MDEDHVDHDQVSDHHEYQKKMKRSTPSGSSCEVDHAETDDGVSVIKDDIDTAPSATTLQHECNICGKTFTNGKALGGHRRSHFQAAKKKLHNIKVKTRFSNHSKVLVEDHSNRTSCDVDGENGEPICYLCKKKFPTKNALYGHMRAHPDRICRGICPPNNNHHSHHEHINNSSDSSLEQNINNKEDQGVVAIAPKGHHTDAIDLSNSTLLPSWQKKDKRGRKCIGSYEAATNLLYLCAEYIRAAESVNYKKGGGGGGSVDVEPPKSTTSPHEVVVPMQSKNYKRKKIGECESSSTGEENAPAHKIKCIFISGSLMKFGSDGGSGGDCDNDKRKSRGKKGLSESGVEKIAVNIMDVEGHCGKKDVMNERSSDIDDDDKRKVKKGKKIIIKDSTDAEKLLGGYECGICGKSFSTFQGLGGHKSVHKEKNIVISDTIMDDESKHSDATVTDEGNKYSPISNIDHVPKVDQDTPPLSEDEEASQSTTEPKNLDFDLNEPYVMLD